MTPPTQLEIADPQLLAAVHRVFNSLPPAARAQLAGARLALITDQYADYLQTRKANGCCYRAADGTQTIMLRPDLAERGQAYMMETIAHEFAHATQTEFHGPDVDEAYAVAKTQAWGFDPADKYPRIDWKR